LHQITNNIRTQTMEQKLKKNRRKSSFRSANQFFRNNEKHASSLADKFELSYPIQAVADADETPVNILCLDGGGMRGYALPVLLSAINEKYGKGKETDVLEHFDLVAGTSVGGAFAITCNLMKSLQESCDEFTDGADDIRERVFSKMKVKSLLKTGASVAKEDQMEAIYKSRWGDTPLLNPLGPKAMALAAVRISNDNQRKESYEPIVLRTYDYPNGETTNDLNDHTSDPLVANSSSFTAVQAIAATTAIPGVVHSITAQLDDRDVSLMDGGLYGNCPLHVAIDEARRLYPRRPLGVVLSIGYNDIEDTFRDRVIKVARRVSPDLHFHRLAPSHITTDFKVSETSLQSVVEMEEKVNDFIWADGEISSALDVTMEKLYSNQTPPATPEFLRRQAMLKSGKFQERARSRQKVREILRNNSSRSRSLTGTGMSNCDLSLSSSQYTSKKAARYSISRDEIPPVSITDVLRTTKLTKENTAEDFFITEGKGNPLCPISIDKTNSTLSLSSSNEEFYTISLNNEKDAISTEENNARCSTSCNKQWWAKCIPCFTLCSGCNVVPLSTNEVDNVNLKIKAISMNREEI